MQIMVFHRLRESFIETFFSYKSRIFYKNFFILGFKKNQYCDEQGKYVTFAVVSFLHTMRKRFTKQVCVTFLIAVSAIWVGSCDTKNQQAGEEEKPAVDTSAGVTTEVPNTSQSELLRTVLGKAGGNFRGLNFNDPISKVKELETFELFEDSTDHVGFTYETENFEAIDVLYYLDKNQLLNGIRVDVYLNDANSVKGLWSQFETYLSGKYAIDKKQGKVAFWKDKGGRMVKLEDVSKGKDFGLRLSIGAKGIKEMPL